MPPGRTSSSAERPGVDGARGLDHDVGALAVPVSAPKSGASARRSGREPTPTGQPPASATHAQSISPIGPSPITATVSPGRDTCRIDAVEAAGEGLDHRRELRRHPGGTCRRFVARDPLGDEDELAIRRR